VAPAAEAAGVGQRRTILKPANSTVESAKRDPINGLIE
jgi:hypothetical protein